MKKSVDYRNIARKNLKGNWGSAILVCLIFILISTTVGCIPVVGTIITLLLTGQLIVGTIIYFVKLNNKEEAKFSSMFEGFEKNLLNNCFTYLLEMLYVFLWTLLFIIPGIIKSYSYAMTMFLKAKNPQLESREAITMSREIMNGKKWSLFCLHFSFIGWILLSFITFGVGFVFLIPYMQASVTEFYEDAYIQYQQFKQADDSTTEVIISEDETSQDA